MWHKELPTYREGDEAYIEFKTGHPDMVGKWKIGDIRVQGGVNNGVAKAKLIKTSRKFQKKVSKYCSTHFNIKVCRTPKKY